MTKKRLTEILTAHMGKAPRFIRRAFNRTDERGRFTDDCALTQVVDNYSPIDGDIIRKTCFACTINGQCTPYAMGHSHMCDRFNFPAILHVSIPKTDCKGCLRDIAKHTDENPFAGFECVCCDADGKKQRHTENISFYAQEKSGLGPVNTECDAFQNPEICRNCGQLDVKKQQEWVIGRQGMNGVLSEIFEAKTK